jgi:hypothetical protein
MDDRQLGQRLVAALPDSIALDPEQVLKALQDLLPVGDPRQEPLEELAHLPEFLAFAKPRQASLQAQDHEQFLLGILNTSYSPEIVARLREVLAGVREKGAPRSPQLMDPWGNSSGASDPISVAAWQRYMEQFNADPVSSTDSSVASSDQTGEASFSKPILSSRDHLPERPQHVRQAWKAHNSIAIEIIDKSINFYKLSGRDLFSGRKLRYYAYAILWPLFAPARLVKLFLSYPKRMQANIEKNIANIERVMAEQQQKQ